MQKGNYPLASCIQIGGMNHSSAVVQPSLLLMRPRLFCPVAFGHKYSRAISSTEGADLTPNVTSPTLARARGLLTGRVGTSVDVTALSN